MYSSSVIKQKLIAEVDVTLSDGSSLKGNFFLNPQERIINMLNDDRHFLPFADSDDVITVVAKAAITSIRPSQQKSEATAGPLRRIGM
ncbi:MAG: hypothetical protein VCB77_06765 [Alphaproteobacteria bacterium]